MTEDLTTCIRKATEVLKSFGAKEVYLFGSAATDEMDEHSDIDLAVTGLPPEVFFRAMSTAHDCLDRNLDLVDLDLEDAFTRYLWKKGGLKRVG